MLVLNAAPMEAARRGKPIRPVQKELLREAGEMMAAEGKDPQTLNPFEKAGYWKKLALQYMAKTPGNFLKTYGKGIFYIFVSLGTSGFNDILDLPQTPVDKAKYTNRLDKLKALNKTTLLIAGILLLYLFSVYSGFIVGAIVSRGKYNGAIILLSCLLALYFVVLTGAAGNLAARFKVPVLPFLFPLAAVGIDYIIEKTGTVKKLDSKQMPGKY